MQRVSSVLGRVQHFFMPARQPHDAYSRAPAAEAGLLEDDEETPLLPSRERQQHLTQDIQNDLHGQFATLIGLPRRGLPPGSLPLQPGAATLYERARRKHSRQACNYWITSTLNNTLLLSQVVIGASLTALGALGHSQTTIVVFGVLNTIIASVVAYMKSRGQPMRSRMYRDDLERVLDEIENSEIMWMGIANGAHGYDEIDIEEEVSVRSEVARLTRLYDRAVRNNTLNNPDLYQLPNGHDAQSSLRGRQGNQLVLPVVPGPATEAPKAPEEATTKPANAPSSEPPAPAATEPKKSADAKSDDAKSGQDTAAGTADGGKPGPAYSAAPGAESSAPAAHMPLTTDIDEGPVTLVKITSASDAGDAPKTGTSEPKDEKESK